MSTLPDHPDKMMPDWLAAQLGAPAGAIKGFHSEQVGVGQMGESFRLRLDWAQRPAGAPASIVAKCPHKNPANRELAKQYNTYELETQWYGQYAKACPTRAPHCYKVELAPNGLDFVLLLEDIHPAQQIDQFAGATQAQIALMLNEAALLHAFGWKQPWLSKDWLNVRDAQLPLLKQVLPPLHAEWVKRYRDRLGADVFAQAEQLVGLYVEITELQNVHPSLAHTDFRLDNILFPDAESRAVILDWQSVQRGPHMSDVAYCIATSVPDAGARAKYEEALVRGYYEQLCANGVQGYSWDACWHEYCRGASSGLIMAIIAGMGVERIERGDELFAVMAERSAWQMRDLDTLKRTTVNQT